MKKILLPLLLILSVIAFARPGDNAPLNMLDTVFGQQIFKQAQVPLHIHPIQTAALDANGTLGTGGCQCIYTIRDSISTSMIVNSFSTPDTLISGPGIGQFIHVLNVYGRYSYSTAVFAFSGFSGGILGDNANYLFNINSPLENASSFYFPNIPQASSQTATFNGQPLLYYSNTANPTGGGGYVILYIDYMIETY